MRFNDVWSRKHVGEPGYGPACGSREPRVNQKVRENYDVPFGAIQLLPTVSTGDDTARIFFGRIRPLDSVGRPPFFDDLHDQTVAGGLAPHLLGEGH